MIYGEADLYPLNKLLGCLIVLAIIGVLLGIPAACYAIYWLVTHVKIVW